MTSNGLIDNSVEVGIPMAIWLESSESVNAREKIIRNKGYLHEKGGIGHSLLFNLDVRPPDLHDFKLADCMREEEIIETDKLLRSGKKVMWEGGDGYGKTTFIGELTQYLHKENPELQISSMSHMDFRTSSSIKRQIERLEHALQSNEPTNLLYIIDSADYLWEKPDNSPDNIDLAQLRIEFMNKLLNSDVQTLMTSHSIEPKNKEVDMYLKRRFELMFGSTVDRKNLSPLYPTDKVSKILQRVGFPKELAEYLSWYESSKTCKHSVLVNYFFKQPSLAKENSGQQFSLERTISYISSFLKDPHNSINDLITVFIDFFHGRNMTAFKDLVNIGF